MRDCEQFAQIAQDKWATVSDSLRSLMINERMSDLLKKIWQKNLKSSFLVCFKYGFLFKKWANRSFPFLVSDVSECSGRLPKIIDVSKSLR